MNFIPAWDFQIVNQSGLQTKGFFFKRVEIL